MINLPMSELVELIKEAISNGGEFRLYPRGTSMLPLIEQGKDSVILVKPGLLSVGDIILYQRKNGQFVLHRIIRKDGEKLVICGDNQFGLEYGITFSDVIAKVSAVFKGEDRIEGAFCNKKFYMTRLCIKRNIKRNCNRFVRMVKDPSLIWRKLKGEKR